MELDIIGFVFSTILFVRAYIFKTKYIEISAICLDYTIANESFVS